jgi:hypothetical protein
MTFSSDLPARAADALAAVASYADAQVSVEADVRSAAIKRVPPAHPTIMSLFGATGLTKIFGSIPVPSMPGADGFSYPSGYRDPLYTRLYWSDSFKYAKLTQRANTVKIALDPQAVHGGLQSLAEYLQRVGWLFDDATSLGLLTYVCATANQNTQPGGVHVPWDDEMTVLRATLQMMWSRPVRPHVIGFDLGNEFIRGLHATAKPDSTAIAQMEAAFQVLAEEWPGYAGSFSSFTNDWSVVMANASDDWYPVMKSIADNAGVPFFMDIHPYSVPDNPAPFSAAQYKAATDLRPTVPLFFGETAPWAGLENADWENVIGFVSDATAGNPSIPGFCFYREDAARPADDTFGRDYEVLRMLRLSTKIDGGNYDTITTDLVPNNLALTSAFQTVGNHKRLKDTDDDPLVAKPPGFQAIGEITGVEGGDQIQAQVVDDAGIILGTGSRLASVTVVADGTSAASLVADTSGHDRSISISGTSPTVTSGGNGKWGEAFSFPGAGGSRLVTPQFAIPAFSYLACWLKPDASGSGDMHIAGQTTSSGTVGDGSSVVELHYDATGQAVGIVYIGSDGVYRQAYTGAGTVPKGAWTYVIGGREAGGFIVAGASSGSNVHLEAPEASNGNADTGDGVTPFTVGARADGTLPYKGLVDSLIVQGSVMPTNDYPTPTGPHVADVNTILLLQLDELEAGTGAGSARIETPMIAVPESLVNASVQIKNLTAVRGNVVSLSMKELKR